MSQNKDKKITPEIAQKIKTTMIKNVEDIFGEDSGKIIELLVQSIFQGFKQEHDHRKEVIILLHTMAFIKMCKSSFDNIDGSKDDFTDSLLLDFLNKVSL